MGAIDHLRSHQYSVPDVREPLGKSPLTVRLYVSDHDAIKAIGKAGSPFVRPAARQALRDHAAQGTSGN